MYEYNATVIEVVDGDTVKLDVDLGFHVHVRESFRLEGINAPEKNTPEGKNAKAFLEIQLKPGDPIIINAHKITDIKQEKYGRWLATISTRSLVDVGATMVATGHALAWDGKGARPV